MKIMQHELGKFIQSGTIAVFCIILRDFIFRIDVDLRQSEAAGQMIHSNMKLRSAEVGQTVRLRIPNVDRGKADLPNILAVVLEEDEGFYSLGSLAGKLMYKYTCNEFEVCRSFLIKIADVPDKNISLRKAVAELSLGGGQGFLRCDCTTHCKTARCKCRKEGFECNSRCHSGRKCHNIL